MHEGQITHGNGGLTGAEHRDAKLGLRVQHGGHGAPVEAHLRYHTHQSAGLIHHAVVHRHTAACAPVQGEGRGPVGVFILGDLGTLKGKITPLLPQIQEAAQALVFLTVGDGLPVGILQLGNTLAQFLVLLLQSFYIVKLIGNGSEPVSDGSSGGAEG